MIFPRFIRWIGWLALAGVLHVQAQSGIPQTGTGVLNKFFIPERNKEGELVVQFKGDRAVHRPDGKWEIEKFILNTFRNSEIDWTLESPYCIMFESVDPHSGETDREAVSESDVHIFNRKINITGIGFHWIVNETQFVIRRNVEVRIDGGLMKDGTTMNSTNKNISLLAFAVGASLFPTAYAENIPVAAAPAVTASQPASNLEFPKPFTKINSDQLNFDYNKKIAVFEGHVDAVDPQLALRCQTMKVFFSEKNNAVMRVEAYGDVHMLQDGKEGIGEKAVYTKETGMIVLTGKEPKLRDEKGNWILSREGIITYNVLTKKLEVQKPTMEFQTGESKPK